MKKNLKFLSGILMASFISNSALTNIEKTDARISRNIVVNSSANSLRNSNKNTSNETPKNNSSENSENSSSKEIQETNGEINKEDTLQEDTSIELNENEDTSISEDESEDSSNNTTNILGMLNSDKSLTKEDIVKLSMPVSHSIEFLDEFKTTFPNLDPLRQISPLFVEIDNYLDVNSNEAKTITKFLNQNTNDKLINFSDQNNSNMLLTEISDLLKELKDEINSEKLPSTIFSLMPTLTVFNDTYKILYLEYDSITKSNNNQITLNILLKDTETKLLSLLDSIKDFKNQLPELTETLNQLAESITQPEENEEEIDNSSTEEETTESDSTESDQTENENNTENSETTNDNTEENEVIEDTEENNISEESTEVEETTDNNDKKEDTEDNKDVDPNSVIVYFGEQGQEIIFDEKTKKYYQIDPENPDSEELIEYKGNVTKMTLAEYLDTDLYFDDKGNELIFDVDTNSYFLYDSEKDEFVLYTGEVTKKKVKDLLESQ